MKWQETGDMPCPVARTLAVLGDRWTLLIIRNSFMATRRFDDFQSQLGMTRHVLAQRLARLVEVGVLEKVPYGDKPVRHEYRLTDMGRELHPLVLALGNWGNRWLSDGQGAITANVHKQCGQVFTPVTVCSECREPVTARDVILTAGPGFQHAVSLSAAARQARSGTGD